MFDVVTIGAATRDIFLTSPLFKVVRDPKHLERLGFPTGEAQCFALGAKIEVGKPFETLGGGAANAAVTFARQGFKTLAFVKMGDDKNGDTAIRDLKDEKISVLPARDKKFGTSYSLILVSPNGERTILDYRGASQHLRTSEVPFRKLNARWAYISPGHIEYGVIHAIVAHLEKQNIKIAMNPSAYYIKMGTKRLRPLLNKLDVISLNREEAAYLAGARYKEEQKIFKKFDELVKGIAVMTDGPKGVLVSDGKRVYRAGVFKEKKILDRTGAGDAFGSAFTVALARRNKIDETGIREGIRLGSANATAVVEAVGATPGILTKKDFARSPRWRKLSVRVKDI